MSGGPLADRIRGLIEANGPMSVADYMAHCLGDPRHGYYMTRDPLGAAGDFITAPEVSQMFGEIVGAWLAHAWQLCGAPAPARLVELGPGRGTLMADVLRVAAVLPRFGEAVSVHLVETSPVLRKAQSATLARLGRDIRWHDSLAAVPEGPLILVANEFLDALPIRQFVRRNGRWQERAIGVDPDGRLSFGVGPAVLGAEVEAPEGAILEASPAREALVAALSHRIAVDGGAALLIDYGHAETRTGDTLQAVRAHVYADPLQSPGEADLTAHVDFAALARHVSAAGAVMHGPITQGEFLLALGLRERAARLAADADAAERAALAAAVRRLAGDEGMGTLFKVMAITPEGIDPPPFPVG